MKPTISQFNNSKKWSGQIYEAEKKVTDNQWRYSVSHGIIQKAVIPKPFLKIEKEFLRKMLKERSRYLLEKQIRKLDLELAEQRIEAQEIGEIDEIIDMIDPKKEEDEERNFEKRKQSYLEKQADILKRKIDVLKIRLAKIESSMGKKIKFFDGQDFLKL